MAIRPKALEFDVALDPDGRLSLPDGTAFTPPDAWTPEHLVLAGLVRCAIASLAFNARRAGVGVVAECRAHSTVSRRDEDGRHAITGGTVELNVTLDRALADDVLVELQERTRRGCFVGASLISAPDYRWSVSVATPA